MSIFELKEKNRQTSLWDLIEEENSSDDNYEDDDNDDENIDIEIEENNEDKKQIENDDEENDDEENDDENDEWTESQEREFNRLDNIGCFTADEIYKKVK